MGVRLKAIPVGLRIVYLGFIVSRTTDPRTIRAEIWLLTVTVTEIQFQISLSESESESERFSPTRKFLWYIGANNKHTQ